MTGVRLSARHEAAGSMRSLDQMPSELPDWIQPVPMLVSLDLNR